MTTTKDDYVIDKHGKRVRRNGILEDGDRVRVPMTLMDAANSLALRDASAQLEDHQLSTFADAVNGGMSLADAIAKAKAVKRIEQFDSLRPPARFGVFDEATQAKRDSYRDAYIARTGDAWKKPTSTDATSTEQVAVVGAAAPLEQLFAARDAVIEARDKRLEAAWQR